MTRSFRIFRKLRRLQALAVAAALACTVVSPAHAGAMFFTVTDLQALVPLPADRYSNSYATAINNAGQVAGTFIGPGGRRTGFFYSDGVVTPLQVSGINTSEPHALTDPAGPSGQVKIVGWGGGVAPGGFLVTMSSTGLQTAVTIGDGSTSVNGINAAGQVVGDSLFGDSNKAFLGDTSGAIKSLGTLGGPISSATAINDAGQVVGRADTATGVSNAFLYAGGKMSDLGSLSPGGGSSAAAINQRGVVVGTSGVADNSGQLHAHAFLYSDGHMTDIIPIAVSSFASGINNSMQVVGTIGTASFTYANALLYSPSGGAADLNSYLNGANGVHVEEAFGINDSGQILARSDALHALLLTPAGSLLWTGANSDKLDDGGNWDSGLGFTPQRSLDVVIAPNTAKNLTASTSFEAKSLTLAGGSAPVALSLANGAVVKTASNMFIQSGGTFGGDGSLIGSVSNRGSVLVAGGSHLTISGTLDNHGLIAGDGVISTRLVNRGDGNVRAVGSGVLTFVGDAHRNEGGGLIAVGGNGELRFSGGTLVNQVNGEILLNAGTLRFDAGLVNAGEVSIRAGGANLFGNVSNDASGKIVAAEASVSTISGRLVNNGEVRLTDGASMRYMGEVAGSGSFSTEGSAALHHFLNRFAPNTAGGAMQMGHSRFSGTLALDIGGPVLGRASGVGHGLINFTGSVTLDAGSVLDLAWPVGEALQLGQSFDLFDYAQSPQGQFGELKLPTLAADLVWDTSDLYVGGELRVAAVPEPAVWALFSAGLLGLAWRGRQHPCRRAL